MSAENIDRVIQHRKMCQCCWNVNRVSFVVPNEIWTAVLEPEMRGRNICLGCFTTLADEKLIEWDKDIQLYPISLYRQSEHGKRSGHQGKVAKQ